MFYLSWLIEIILVCIQVYESLLCSVTLRQDWVWRSRFSLLAARSSTADSTNRSRNQSSFWRYIVSAPVKNTFDFGLVQNGNNTITLTTLIPKALYMIFVDVIWFYFFSIDNRCCTYRCCVTILRLVCKSYVHIAK